MTAFAPQRDLSADPPVNETDDSSIGLMRDFVISAFPAGFAAVSK